jgi:hypothetical protein
MPSTSNKRRTIVLGIWVFTVLILAVILYREYRKTPVPGKATAQLPSDTLILTLPPSESHAALQTPEEQAVGPEESTTTTRLPAPTRRVVVGELKANVQIFEYIRDFYRDVTQRSLSMTLASARLVTSGETGWDFDSDGTGRHLAKVRRTFVVVDSAYSLRKYIFPGWGYGADWVPSSGENPAFEGRLERKPGVFALAASGLGENKANGKGSVGNQVGIRLHSRAGCAYSVRLGIECIGQAESTVDTTYYTAPMVVEFPAVYTVATIPGGAADTVFVATQNPRTIREVAELLPRTFVSAVLFDAGSAREGVVEDLAALTNIKLSVNRTSSLSEAFIILNTSQALVESQWLDPAFVRIVESHLEFVLREGPLEKNTPDRPALHLSRLIEDRQSVAKLLMTFRRYLASSEESG